MSDLTSKPKHNDSGSFAVSHSQNRDSGRPKIDSAESTDAQFKALLKQARTNPTEAAVTVKSQIGRSRADHDQVALIGSVVAYEAALALKASPDEWKAFAESPLWSDFKGHKPKADEPEEEYLRWMMVFVHEAKDEQGKDRANVYRGALQAKFKEDAEAETLIAFVRNEGGINAAYRNALKKAKKPKVSDAPAEASHLESETEDDGDSKDSTNVEGESESTTESDVDLESADKALFSRIESRLKGMKGRRLKPMLLGVSPEILTKVTGRYVESGEVNIRCTLTRKPDGWVEMTCIKAWRSSSKSNP